MICILFVMPFPLCLRAKDEFVTDMLNYSKYKINVNTLNSYF